MSNTKRRVVITGLGIVSPVGNDLQSSWENIKNGVSGIAKITRFDISEYSTQIAGEVKNFNIDDYMEPKESRRVDYFIRYGIAAGIQAVRDAKLEENSDIDKLRVGVIVGSGIGGLHSIEDTSVTLHERGVRRVSPFFITGSIGNMISGQLSIKYGYKGVNYGVVSACASSNHSIGEAMKYIMYDECDVMLAGGAEGTICPVGIGGFIACKALSTRNDEPEKASRPWDNDRDGFIMGEGAAILVLEEYEHAKRRGAKIYAELVGYGASSDAYHITTPTVEGPLASMRLALKNAKLEPSLIDYINAHGTSTQIGDLNETRAMKECFGKYAYQDLIVSSTKSMTGHLLGAAGAIEAVFTIMALRHNVVPPTINLDNPSPECDLDFAPHHSKGKQIEYAMSNSFGFGGTNATIIFKKVE